MAINKIKIENTLGMNKMHETAQCMKIKPTKIRTHKTATEIKEYFRTNHQIKAGSI